MQQYLRTNLIKNLSFESFLISLKYFILNYILGLIVFYFVVYLIVIRFLIYVPTISTRQQNEYYNICSVLLIKLFSTLYLLFTKVYIK